MDWKTMLAYVTRAVDEHRLLCITYLVAETVFHATRPKDASRFMKQNARRWQSRSISSGLWRRQHGIVS